MNAGNRNIAALVFALTVRELTSAPKEELEQKYEDMTGEAFEGTKKELVRALKEDAEAILSRPAGTPTKALKSRPSAESQRSLDAAAYAAVKAHGSYAAAAKALGTAWETVWGRAKRHEKLVVAGS